MVDGAPEVEAKVVNWRLYPGGSKMVDCGENGFYNQFNRVLKDGKPYTFVRAADVLVPDGWCHVNRNETVAEMMRDYDYYQGTGDLGKPDLLSDRVFGAITRKKGGMFLTAVTCLHPCKGADEWRRRPNEMLDSLLHPANIPLILATLEVYQFRTRLVSEEHSRKMPLISVTLETFQLLSPRLEMVVSAEHSSNMWLIFVTWPVFNVPL